MKGLFASVLARLPVSLQLSLCGVMLAGSLSAQSVEQQQQKIDTFQDNIELVVSPEKQQHISWRSLYDTDGIKNPLTQQVIEKGLDSLEQRETGQKLFRSLQKGLNENDSLFSEDFRQNRKIAITDNTDEGINFSPSINEDEQQIEKLQININMDQLRLTGYPHQDITLPISIEQAIVHESGHCDDDIKKLKNGNIEEKLSTILYNQRANISQDLSEKSDIFNDYVRYDSMLTRTSNELVLNADLKNKERKDLLKQAYAYKDSISMAEDKLLADTATQRIFQIFEENKDSLITIGLGHEKAAMAWENKFLEEVGLPQRTEYGGMNCLLTKEQKDVMHVEDQQAYNNRSDIFHKKDLGYHR